MKSLIKWQMVSFLSRSIAMVLGIIQGAIIFRLLTQTEFGIKELALSIGGALGIYQHLGLSSASTREIAAAKDDTEVFKIFITSIFVRYCVTLPIAIGLFFSANYISGKYPGLKLPLKLYAIALLFQGFQGILNAVIAGTKRFKHLFIYQVAIAFVSVFLYVPLVYFFKVEGFFYAFLLFNIISSIALSILAFQPLRGKLTFPSKADFLRLLKDIFSVSLAIYAVKILYTNWEKLGNNMLGLFVSAEAVALYGFAMIFSKKLMLISDSVTDVSLPVLSEKYTKDIQDFKKTFAFNFNKVFAVIVIAAALGSYWVPQVLILYGGFDKYLEYKASLRLIPPLVLSFVIYSLINIVKSSILVPAKLVKSMVFGMVIMLISTLMGFFLFRDVLGPLYSMAWSMALGAVFSLFYLRLAVKKSLDYEFLNYDHLLLMFQSFAISFLGPVDITWVKLASFLPLFSLLVWGVFISKFVTKSEVILLYEKAKKLFSTRLCKSIRN